MLALGENKSTTRRRAECIWSVSEPSGIPKNFMGFFYCAFSFPSHLLDCGKNHARSRIIYALKVSNPWFVRFTCCTHKVVEEFGLSIGWNRLLVVGFGCLIVITVIEREHLESERVFNPKWFSLPV